VLEVVSAVLPIPESCSRQNSRHF